MTPDEHKALIREYFAAWDAGEPEAIAAFFADDFSTTYTAPTGDEVRVEPADVREWIADWLGVIADTSHEVRELVAEDDVVMARVTYRGVHAGELLGIEPTGNRVEVEEYLRFRLADGEIAELDWLGDDAALLRQLGVDLPIEP